MKIKTLFERSLHNWPVKIISLVAALLLFFFYRVTSLEERFFNIPLSVKIHENFTAKDNYPETVRIIIKGRPDDIKLVLEDEIKAVVDFSKYGREGEFREPVQIHKKGFTLDIKPLEIRVEPRELKLSIEPLIVKTLPVLPTVIGFPERGYELIQDFVTPSSVEIYGGKSKIENLKVVRTEDIDISSRISNFTTRVRLKKPDPSLAFSGGAVVEFTASINERIETKKMTSVDVIAIDLEKNLKIDSFQGDFTMEIQGKMLDLEEFIPADFRFTVDCSTLKNPGSYNLPVLPDVPSGILVLNYEPKEIKVNILRVNK